MYSPDNRGVCTVKDEPTEAWGSWRLVKGVVGREVGLISEGVGTDGDDMVQYHHSRWWFFIQWYYPSHFTCEKTLFPNTVLVDSQNSVQQVSLSATSPWAFKIFSALHLPHDMGKPVGVDPDSYVPLCTAWPSDPGTLCPSSHLPQLLEIDNSTLALYLLEYSVIPF